MIRVSTKDELFNHAYCNAHRALPVETLETPRQYGERWREAYKCGVDGLDEFPHRFYVFNNDADYTYFMMKWS